MGNKASAQITGYQYFMSIHMGVSRGPVDEIRQLKANDLLFMDSTNGLFGIFDHNQDWDVEQPFLFGGDDKEGGLTGTMTFLFGAEDQTVPDYVKTKMVTGQKDPDDGTPLNVNLIPEFRGVTTLFYDGQICANNPYPKAWKIRACRNNAGWEDDATFYPDKAEILIDGGNGGARPQAIRAMNPSHIIYECATNSAWGRGLDPAFIDSDSFIAAADTLKDEGFGLCIAWGRTDDIDSFVQSVLNHCGGALYIDRTTGLLTFRLIRADFDPDVIPSFDYGSGLLSINDDQAAATDTNYNEVVVTYNDPMTDTQGQVRVQNLAAVMALNGRIISTTTNYPGLPTAALALRVAQRDVSMQASSLRRFTVELDRSAWHIPPGGVFKISAPSRGIDNLVLRAGEVKDSKISDGTITIQAVQDVFSLPATSFIAVQPHVWTPPDRSAHVIATRKLEEISYFDIAHFAPASSLTAAQDAPDSTGMKVWAKQPTDMSTDFLIDDAAGIEAFAVRGAGTFNSLCQLVGDIGYYDTDITFTNGSLMEDVEIGEVALIGDEYVRIDDIDVDLGQATIARGCLDTIPAPHSDGDVLWSESSRPSIDNRTYAIAEVLHVKLLTRTSSAQLAEADAPTDDLTLRGRQGRPYPPGNFQINTIPFGSLGTTVIHGVDIALTWAHRDRIQQGDFVVEHGASDNGPEDDVNYTVRIYNDTANTLVRTASGFADNHWTYTAGMQTADRPDSPIRVELEAHRDSFVSWQKYVVLIYLTAPTPTMGVGFDEDFDYNFNGDVGFSDGFDDNFDG